MTDRILRWLFIVVLLIAGYIVGSVLSSAWAGEDDPFVARLELLFGVHPGQPLPVDMRAPDIHLQYMDATPVGHGCYAIKVCRVR